jgi:hypothetical protein
VSSNESDLCTEGHKKILERAQAIVQRTGDPLRLANAIYGTAWEHGGWVASLDRTWTLIQHVLNSQTREHTSFNSPMPWKNTKMSPQFEMRSSP